MHVLAQAELPTSVTDQLVTYGLPTVLLLGACWVIWRLYSRQVDEANQVKAERDFWKQKYLDEVEADRKPRRGG